MNLSDTAWQAVCYGNHDGLAQTLSRLLSRFPGQLCADPPRHPPLLPTQAAYPFPTRSNDAAVIVLCPLAEPSVLDFAALQILATYYQPRFFTLFREEMNIGYVVSCRFQQIAGQAGLLFALQSPSVAAAELYQHIIRFVQAMTHMIAALSPAALREKIRLMQRRLPSSPPTTPAECVQHWLHQPRSLPPITADVYQQVTATVLNNTQHRLLTAIHQCWHLHNLPASGD